MKKILSLVLAASMLMAFASCSSTEEEAAGSEETTTTTAAAETPEEAAKQAAVNYIDTLAAGDIEAAAALTTEDSVINTYLNEVEAMGGGNGSVNILGEYLGAYFSRTEITMTSTSASGDIVTVNFAGKAPKISDIEDYLESEEGIAALTDALSGLGEDSTLDDLTVAIYESSITGIEQASQGKWSASLDVDTSGDTPVIIDNEDFYPQTSTDLTGGTEIASDTEIDTDTDTDSENGSSAITASDGSIGDSIDIVGSYVGMSSEYNGVAVTEKHSSDYVYMMDYDDDDFVIHVIMKEDVSEDDVYVYDVYCNGEQVASSVSCVIDPDKLSGVYATEYTAAADGNTWEYVFYAPDSTDVIAYMQLIIQPQ